MTTFSKPNPDFGWPELLDPMGEVAPAGWPAAADVFSINQYAAPLKDSAAPNAQAVSTLLFGEPVVWLDGAGSGENPRLCQSLIDGYKGYLKTGSATAMNAKPTHRVTALSSHAYSAPDIKSPVSARLPMGAMVAVSEGEETGRFLLLTSGAFVLKQHVQPVGTHATDPVKEAEVFIGAPYLWGGRSADGIDCSGLIQMTLARCGMRTLRDSGSQFKSIGELLPEGVKPGRGDLAFFPGHVGWMVSETHLLHANATHMAVTIDPLDDVIRWVASETDQPPFTGFRRLKQPFAQ